MIEARRQYLLLSRRAVVNLTRNPVQIVPSITFPLLFLGLTSAALQRSTQLPGFPPVDSFAQFAIAASIVQGVLFGAVQAGSAMAIDIEGGFFERLIAAPVSRYAILVGRVAGAALTGAVQALLFLLVAAIFGVVPEGGVVAVALVAVAAALLAAGIGALVSALGLRTGSSEAVQGMFPLVFAGLFLSSAFFPRDLMHGWFKTAATFNPLSHIIEGLRFQIIHGVDLERWLISMSIASVVLIVGLFSAKAALEARIRAKHH